MAQFSEEHSKLLLSKEWLVKSDSQTSTPYLFKFYSNTVDLSCCVLLTDTKSVWVEVLTSQQFARRWRDCNPASVPHYTYASEDEDSWRSETLELLSRAHTLGAIADVSFEIVQSNYSDLAFELTYDAFKWKWETCFLGHRTSAEIISKHLIFPLISLNHLTLSSPQVVSELSDADIEKAIDKIGRTARRSIDTHIKNAVSKPRTASALRRMAAVFNFISDLPPVVSTAEKPGLDVAQPTRPEAPIDARPVSVAPQIEDTSQGVKLSHVESGGSLKPPVPGDDNSATEESETEDNSMNEDIPKGSQPPPRTSESKPLSRSTSVVRSSPQRPASTKDEPDSDYSPARPAKKLKKPPTASSTDDDSDEESKPRVAQTKGVGGPGGPGGIKRGTRQPIKRGGKRF